MTMRKNQKAAGECSEKRELRVFTQPPWLMLANYFCAMG